MSKSMHPVKKGRSRIEDDVTSWLVTWDARDQVADELRKKARAARP